jgi:trk system potassium uptake protein
LGMTAWLYVVGTIVLAGLCGAGHLAEHDPRWIAQTASVLSVESRTGGLPIIQPAQISHAAQWVLILLMAVGASPAGTGGGLKTTTLFQLVAGVRKLLRGESAGSAFPIAIVWLSVFVGLVLGAVILLSFVVPGGNSDSIFFNAVSGVSNVGFSLSPIPEQPNVLFAYCAIMLVGRMTPLLILWWMADVVKGPEIAVG